MHKKLFRLSLIVIIFFTSCSNKKEENFYTGLKVYKEFDKSRKFDTTSNEKADFYFRPVKIDLFYPSREKPNGEPLSFGDMLNTYELRMNYNISADSCRKASAELAKAIADYLHIDSFPRLLSYKTGIYNDLAFPEKKFPLIIYAAGMNGSSWENVVLFDSLAKSGYAVAAVSSVGKFPGFMSEAVDLDEQVQDILFTKQEIKRLPFIDSNRIGLLSWSLGGSAITKAAMLSNDFKCLLSQDGTEIHYYGFDTAWDKQFNQIMQIYPFDPPSIHIPYMYLSSKHPDKIDSIYIFPDHIGSEEKYFFQFNGGEHEDFSSIFVIAKSVAPKLGNIDSGRHEIICGLALNFFNQYLKEQSDRKLTDKINELVAGSPKKFSIAYPKK